MNSCTRAVFQRSNIPEVHSLELLTLKGINQQFSCGACFSFFPERRALSCPGELPCAGMHPTIANPGCFWVQPGFIVYLYQFASEGGVPSGNHVIPCAWKARCTMPRLFAPRFREMHHGFPKMHHDFARCTRLPSKMHHENGKCTKLFLKCTRVNGKMHPAFLILSK